jgi:hypothetical protein
MRTAMNHLSALTHHEIIAMAAPFVRRGLHVDLAASDRSARKLLFKGVDRPGSHGLCLRETLQLECRPTGHHVLMRTLVHPGGASATLLVDGPLPDALLDAVESVPPASHFEAGEGWLIARSWELLGTVQARPLPLFLSQGVLHLDELTLTLTLRMPGFRSVAGDIELQPHGEGSLELPEDLLAVQGWDWARLLPKRGHWTSKLRLRGKALRRSRTAEAALQQAARHLVRVFAEPPTRFHERHRAARWGMVLRRGIPTLTALSMIGGALLLPRLADTTYAGVWMALHYVPIALLAFSFSLQELPQFEIPRPPRRLRGARWRELAAEPEARRATA